jgi:L-methionine (R)-S-oxide reductase
MSVREERARAIAEEIRRAGNYRWVGLYDVTSKEVALIAFAGPGAPAYPVFPIGKGLTAVAVKTREPVISNDVAGDPRYLTALESTGSEMIVPVMDDNGVVVGTVDVESGSVGAFDERDSRLIHERMGAVRAALFNH